MNIKQIIRRTALGTLLLGLVSSSGFLMIQNSELAQAIEKKQAEQNKPVDNPVVPNPTPSDIQEIRDKLKADGCNFNADATAKRTALGKCSVLLIGDSLGNNLAYGMIGQLADSRNVTFTRTAKASTGLSNPWFYNWHNTLATFLKTYKPNLVIVFLGANDRQDYVVQGVTQHFGTEAWKKTYQSNITKIASAATKSGAYVLWVGMPIMKPYNYAKGETLIDQQFALTVPKTPGAIYLPTRAFTADSAGNYRQNAIVNGKSAQLRGEDGIHFTSMGQQVLATYVINSIIKTFHVEIKPRNPQYITK